MSYRTSESKASNTNKVSVGRGVANLITLNGFERDEHLATKRAVLIEGFDPLQDEAVASSDSRGIAPRTFTRWDPREHRHRK